MKAYEIIKTTFNLIGVYSAGAIISTSFVLLTNDMFYNIVFRNLIGSKGNKKEIWKEIRPREIFNTGAKGTFINHQIDEERNDDINRYHNYIEQRKKFGTEGEDEEKKLYENIFEKNDKIKNL